MKHPGIYLLSVAFLLAGLPARAGVEAGSPADLRDGFYLLHQTCDEESQVSMITLLKTTPPEVVDYVKRISRLAGKSVDTLDDLRDSDAALRGAKNPLPPFERASRASISDEKQHLLLFGSKGGTFAKRLLFTQIEASNYIASLAKVWAERDPDASHEAAMRKMAEEWTKMRDEGYRLLDAGG